MQFQSVFSQFFFFLTFLSLWKICQSWTGLSFQCRWGRPGSSPASVTKKFSFNFPICPFHTLHGSFNWGWWMLCLNMHMKTDYWYWHRVASKSLRTWHQWELLYEQRNTMKTGGNAWCLNPEFPLKIRKTLPWWQRWGKCLIPLLASVEGQSGKQIFPWFSSFKISKIFSCLKKMWN